MQVATAALSLVTAVVVAFTTVVGFLGQHRARGKRRRRARD